MIRDLTLKFAFWFFGGSDVAKQRGITMVFSELKKNKKENALLLTCNILAAVFEGGTMAIFAIAVALLVGDEAMTLADSLGTAGAYFDTWLAEWGRYTLFVVLVLMGVLSQLARSALQYGGVVAAAYLQAGIMGRMKIRAVNHFMRMSFKQISNYQMGELSTVVGQSGKTASFISGLNKVTASFLILLAYVSVLIWLSVSMTMAAALIAVCFSLVLVKLIHRLEHIGKELYKTGVRMSKKTIEYFYEPKLIRIFSRQDHAAETIGKVIRETIGWNRKSLLIKGLIHPLLESMTFVLGGVFLISSLLVYGVDQASTVLPIVLAFLYVLNRMMGSVGSINQARASIIQVIPALVHVEEFLKVEDKEFERIGGRKYSELSREIKLDHVSFTYSGRVEKAISDIDLEIRKGSMVAFVGPSGAGKSTLIDLILGLYDPTAGRVLIDGVDLVTMDIASWRQRVGVVTQDITISNMSIKENIAFGKLDATDEEILRAGELACIDEFIQSLPMQYDTIVGHKGHKLSGGQKQRIALARGLIKMPDVLILDEATSALDSKSEQLIQRAIERLKGDITIIAIAHRLSTIVAADQIFVMDEGRISESGCHADLIGKKGQYSEYWSMQGEKRRSAAVG